VRCGFCILLGRRNEIKRTEHLDASPPKNQFVVSQLATPQFIASCVRTHEKGDAIGWAEGKGEKEDQSPTLTHSLSLSLSHTHTHTHTQTNTPSTQNFSVLIYALGTPGTPRKSSRCSDYLDAPAQHSTSDPPTLDFPSLTLLLTPHIAAPRISSPSRISSAIKF
jgi:hypothetical protein